MRRPWLVSIRCRTRIHAHERGPASPVVLTRFLIPAAFGVLPATLLGPLASWAQPTPCVVPDAGGTVALPPAGCGYVSPQELHMIIDGLPAGTTVEIDPIHAEFFNVTTFPGGTLGGEIEIFDSILQLSLQGTGALGGYSRVLTLPVGCETHTAPRTIGAHVQSFDTEMFRLQGQITGDPDFEFLRVTAGTGFGLPSPGHTTLTRQGSSWNVDSFFDITYRIDFEGSPGGPFAGMAGSTMGTVRMQAGLPVPPLADCLAPDNGTGTADLPPVGCGYMSPDEVPMLVDGLPPGTTINVATEASRFFNVETQPGGVWGGQIETFNLSFFLDLYGTGDLEGYHHRVEVPAVQCETHTGPRHPGMPVQSFPAELFRMQGEVMGDPHFDLLRITAGTGFGMPSPGQTTLIRDGAGGSWNVDSFFDITYRIDYVGAPGGPLGGVAGSTTGTIRMRTGNPDPTVGVEPAGVAAQSTRLLAVRPNPIQPSATIPFVLASGGRVQIRVYDVSGRIVRTLADEALESGEHAVVWDGQDAAGRRLGAGTYFFELRLDGQVVDSRKASIVK